jgi:dolichol-phosphate mannosyltransferase
VDTDSARLSRTLVAIATYNEAGNIERLVDRVLRSSDEVDLLITDDSSPDGTGEILDRIAATEPRLRVIHRATKSGVASAHVNAFRFALDEGYGNLLEMDADFSHDPDDVPRLIAAVRRADVACGSRLMRGGRIIGRPRSRDLLTRAGGLYTRLVLGLRLTDPTAGFRCSSRRALEVLDLDAIRSRGYGMQMELNWAFKRAGIRVVEIPIVFREREEGVSKMTFDILLESWLCVVRLRLGRLPAAVRSTAGLVRSA